MLIWPWVKETGRKGSVSKSILDCSAIVKKVWQAGGKFPSQSHLSEKALSPRDKPTLASLMCSVTGREQPVRRQPWDQCAVDFRVL